MTRSIARPVCDSWAFCFLYRCNSNEHRNKHRRRKTDTSPALLSSCQTQRRTKTYYYVKVVSTISLEWMRTKLSVTWMITFCSVIVTFCWIPDSNIRHLISGRIGILPDQTYTQELAYKTIGKKYETSASKAIRKAPLAEAQIALGKQEIRSVERGICPIAEMLWKLLPHAELHSLNWNRAIGCKLWPKTSFNMAAVATLNFKSFHICHVTVIEFQICCCVPNFIKIRWFFV